MTADEVLAAAEAAQAKLAGLEDDLADQIEQIREAAFLAKRPVTAAETAQRNQLESDLSAVRAARQEVAFVALQQLDNSSTVAAMRRRVDGVNAGLSDVLDRLQRIAAITAAVADVAATLATLAGSLAALGI